MHQTEFREFIHAVRPDIQWCAAWEGATRALSVGTRVAVAMPPRWGTSTLFSELYPAYLLATTALRVGVYREGSPETYVWRGVSDIVRSDEFTIWLDAYEARSGLTIERSSLLERVNQSTGAIQNDVVVIDVGVASQAPVVRHEGMLGTVVCGYRQSRTDVFAAYMEEWAQHGQAFVYNPIPACVDGRVTTESQSDTQSLRRIQDALSRDQWRANYMQYVS